MKHDMNVIKSSMGGAIGAQAKAELRKEAGGRQRRHQGRAGGRTGRSGPEGRREQHQIGKGEQTIPHPGGVCPKT